jgi:hypothetical protein
MVVLGPLSASRIDDVRMGASAASFARRAGGSMQWTVY